MTDKIQKIREEVEIVVNRRLNLLNGDYFDLNKEVNGFTNEIIGIIDFMQEEPVSEDLEEAAEKYAYELFPSVGVANTETELAFKAGAKWQKEQIMAKAGNGRIDAVSNRQTRAHITVAFDSPRNIEVLDRLKVIVIKEG